MHRMVAAGAVAFLGAASAGLALAQAPPHAGRADPCAGRAQRREIPALYARTERRVLVNPARTIRTFVPALYRREERSVEVPGPPRIEHAPAVYQDVGRRVLLEPAHPEWRPTRGRFAETPVPGPDQTLVTPTGEVLCRVWVPARYGWAPHRVLVRPASSAAVPGPPTTRTVVRHVLVRPAHWERRTVPAEYRSVVERRLVRPAHVETVEVPGDCRRP